jgi:TRAP transporter TAXI family solute receptor
MASQPDKLHPHQPATRWLYVVGGVLVVGAICATVLYLGPIPPRVVVMSTGSPGGAYDELAKRYKEILARSHVELKLVESAGAVENLKRLNDPHAGVSVAFVQNGLTTEKDSPSLVSLGTIAYEPTWLFYLGAAPGIHLEGLRGRKVSIGPEGSGSRAIALELLSRNGIGPQQAELLPLTLAETGDQMLSGKIAAAIIVAGWDAPVVRRLLAEPRVELASIPRANAYVALDPYLDKLTLPAGVGSMSADRPPENVTLVAPKTSLVVRGDLHPAIQYVLLDAASQVHSGAGVFHKSGQFPAAEQFDVPLSADARQFYKAGPPFLQRYLPFWLAVLAGRLLVLLIPVIGVAYPLARFLPVLYEFSMKRRVFRLYGELKFIELELESKAKGEQVPAELLDRLKRLEERANHLRLPTGFAHLDYTLREHINLVKSQLPLPEMQRGDLKRPLRTPA